VTNKFQSLSDGEDVLDGDGKNLVAICIVTMATNDNQIISITIQHTYTIGWQSKVLDSPKVNVRVEYFCLFLQNHST
jgi:hypothetical protein